MNYPDLIWRLIELLLQKDNNQQIITNSDNNQQIITNSDDKTIDDKEKD